MTKSRTQESAEFKNFREVTRKILAVPKKEIDQEKIRYEKDRAKIKKEKPAK
jgi:hypothetical protein